ncbi:MAG: hypothetical protein JNM91_12275, partial [Flavobacteriales bacterium]|nr:hypothetical protein [Flavobacteriales bacterium]
QAIYRWRNGEARQFTELPLLFGKQGLATGEEHEGVLVRTHLPIAPLITNYRSARTIIRTNNQLFDALREKLPSAHRTVYEAQAQDEKQEALGHVHLRCYAPVGTDDDDEESAPAPPRFALECVTEALHDGFVAGDIAILVRTKAQGRAVADHLIAHGHQVVSPDGLTLGSDIAVRAMMAVFTWLHRPDDVMAAQALQAMALLRGAAEAADPFGGGSPHQLLAELCHAYPGINAGTPLLPLLHAITDMLGVHPAHDAFVLGALNEANSFRQEHGDSPLAFIDHWKRVAEKRSVGGAPNDHAVRVMTVHASKGLQFPVVIVPWADMASRAPKDRVWIDPREVVPDLPAALIRPVKPLDELGIEEVTTEQELAQLDLMDLLYVSFTRPEQRLYAGIDGKAKSGIAVWLREHFRLEPGQDHLIGPRDPAPARKKEAVTAQPITDVPLPRRKATLAIRAEAPAEWDPADPDPFRTHGRALHAVLARVRTVRDLDEAIRYEANVWGLSASTQTAIRDLLNNVLTSPLLAPFFGEGVQVRTEAALIDTDGHTIRPDRVISDQQRTRVLDIKTGASKDAHYDQVRHYAHVLRAAGEPEVSAHLLYLDASAGTFDLIPVQA